MDRPDASSAPHPRPTALSIALCAISVAAAFYLWIEHRPHLLGVLPYVLLVACPIMHLLMHRGHHRHHDAGTRSEV